MTTVFCIKFNEASESISRTNGYVKKEFFLTIFGFLGKMMILIYDQYDNKHHFDELGLKQYALLIHCIPIVPSAFCSFCS